MAESGVVVELPDSLRDELKAPLGPIFTDADDLLAEAGSPIIAVGDIVTYHLLEADRTPDVALVDGRTKREQVDREITESVGGFDREVHVENPPATLTEDLLLALVDGMSRPETVIVVVDGEEDLAALPAVLAAPDGASVVYGQPDRGMVLASVDDALRAECRALLDRMNGDVERLFELLAR